MRILRERLARFTLNQRFIRANQSLPFIGFQIGVEMVTLAVFILFQNILEVVMIDFQHDIGIHLDETAIAVISKARIAGTRRNRFHRHIIETEIEHGIHHARHRGTGTRAHRQQKRIFRIAKNTTRNLAHFIERCLNLRFQIRRIGLFVFVIIGTDFGADGQTGRNWQAEIAHLRQIGPLAAEQITHIRLPFGTAVTERINPFCHAPDPFMSLLRTCIPLPILPEKSIRHWDQSRARARNWPLF